MDSSDSAMRKAGCAVLGVIAEGCCDAIRPLISSILPRLLHSIKDEDYFVRECACFALGVCCLPLFPSSIVDDMVMSISFDM